MISKKMTRLLPLLGLIVSISACSSPTVGPGPITTATGSFQLQAVVLAIGAPKADATVLLSRGGVVVAQAKTDAAGKVVFSSLAAGDYSLGVADVTGFKLPTVVTVTLDQSKTVELKLQQLSSISITCVREGNSGCLAAGDALTYTHGAGISGLTFDVVWQSIEYPWPQVPSFSFTYKVGGGTGLDTVDVSSLEEVNPQFKAIFQQDSTVRASGDRIYPCHNDETNLKHFQCYAMVKFVLSLYPPGSVTERVALATTETEFFTVVKK